MLLSPGPSAFLRFHSFRHTSHPLQPRLYRTFSPISPSAIRFGPHQRILYSSALPSPLGAPSRRASPRHLAFRLAPNKKTPGCHRPPGVISPFHRTVQANSIASKLFAHSTTPLQSLESSLLAILKRPI